MFRFCSRVVVCDGSVCVFCLCVFVGGVVRVFVYVCFPLRVRVCVWPVYVLLECCYCLCFVIV